jgi:hypothetical protein
LDIGSSFNLCGDVVMPKYNVKFEFYGRTMQTTIEAESQYEARRLVRNRVNIHAIDEVKQEPPKSEFGDIIEKFMKGFGA